MRLPGGSLKNTKNERSAYIQKDSAGVVNGGDNAGGFFVLEWAHLQWRGGLRCVSSHKFQI